MEMGHLIVILVFAFCPLVIKSDGIGSSISLEKATVLPGAGIKTVGSAIFDAQWVPLIWSISLEPPPVHKITKLYDGLCASGRDNMILESDDMSLRTEARQDTARVCGYLPSPSSVDSLEKLKSGSRRKRFIGAIIGGAIGGTALARTEEVRAKVNNEVIPRIDTLTEGLQNVSDQQLILARSVEKLTGSLITQLEVTNDRLTKVTHNLTGTINTNNKYMSMAVNSVNLRSMANVYKFAHSLFDTKVQLYRERASMLRSGTLPDGWCDPSSKHFRSLLKSLQSSEAIALPRLEVAQSICSKKWTVLSGGEGIEASFVLMYMLPISGLIQPIYEITPFPIVSGNQAIMSPPDRALVVNDPTSSLWSRFSWQQLITIGESDLQWLAIDDTMRLDIDESDCYQGLIETGLFDRCKSRVGPSRGIISTINYEGGLWISGSGNILEDCNGEIKESTLTGHVFWKASGKCSYSINGRSFLHVSQSIESSEMFVFPDAYVASSTPLRITHLPAVTQSAKHYAAFERLRNLHSSLKNITQDMVVTNNRISTLDKIKSLSDSWGLPDISEWISAIAWSTVLTAWCALNTAGLVLVYKNGR